MSDWRRLITVEPDKLGGKPCVRGMRISVADVLEYLASGMTVDEVLSDFPDLTREDVLACLAYAAARERGTVQLHENRASFEEPSQTNCTPQGPLSH